MCISVDAQARVCTRVPDCTILLVIATPHERKRKRKRERGRKRLLHGCLLTRFARLDECLLAGA
jgi:hypothetical protein